METIVAISTAPGLGGIGIIRISGEKAFNIILKIFKNKKIKSIKDIKPNTIIYGHITDLKGSVIDEVMVSFFKAPFSYTRENVVEINSHGGSIVMQKILEVCLDAGASLAEPGEFTKRAFLNGRIDLTKVEAVSSILNAKSESELNISNLLLEGHFSDRIKDSKENLLHLLMHLEVNIDYPEYNTPELTKKEIKEITSKELKEYKNLASLFKIGNKIRDGINLAIVGKPNSGKSSLLNFLLNEERAIVTDIAGTTRDTIEEKILIDGIPVNIIDTAGIHKTNEVVEKIGIDKSLKKLKEADLVIVMIDISNKIEKEDIEIFNLIKNKDVVFLLNKIDITKKFSKNEFIYLLKEANINANANDVIEFSCTKKIGFNELYKRLQKRCQTISTHKNSDLIIIHKRQMNIINKIIKNLEQVQKEIEEIPSDIISLKIQEIVNNLNELTGENVQEEILNEIFSNFCLGK